MLYNSPTGGAPNDPYVGKNVSAGQQGSRIPPKAVEAPQRELVRLITEAGLASPSNDDLTQVLQAIRSGKLGTYIDVGTVPNQIVLAPITGYPALFKSLRLRIWPAFVNTGACNITIGTLTASLTRKDGSALLAKDINPAVPFDCTYDGNVFRLTGFAASEVPRITANPVLWIRTDGDDGNDGSANSPTAAFRTLDAAIVRSAFLFSGSGVTLQLGNAGTYAAPTTGLRPNGTLTILGDASNQGLYIIQGATGASSIFGVSGGGGINFTGVTLQATGAGCNHIATNGAPNVIVQNVTFANLLTNSLDALLIGGTSILVLKQGCIFSGSMRSIFNAAAGTIYLGNSAITVNGTPNYSLATAIAVDGGRIISSGASFSGAATGQRYSVYANGLIDTAGGGGNLFPGNSAGSSGVTGGQYV